MGASPEQRRTYYQAWRQRTIGHLGGVCRQCESRESLQLDHINPSDKAREVSKFWAMSWEKQLPELDKCQLLCLPCHTNKHAAAHGSLGMYRHHKCRCDVCKKAWNAHYGAYKRRKRAELKADKVL